MNGIASLQRQARQLLTEVLNEKDVVISSFSQQIYDYQQQISQLSNQLEKINRVPVDIEEHNLQDLIRENFISSVQDRFHLLIDVSALIRQNHHHLKMDSKAQIIKQINTDSQIAYSKVSSAFQKVQIQNQRLIKHIKQKEQQSQALHNSLQNELKCKNQQHSKERQQLLQRINLLQDQNQMMYLQGKQRESQRPNKYRLNEQHQKLLRQCQEKDKTIITLNNLREELNKVNKQLSLHIAQLTNQISQNQQEKAQMARKYLQSQNNSILLAKKICEQVSNTIPQPSNELYAELQIQSKVKKLQFECSQLMKQKDEVSLHLQQLKQQNVVLGQKNQLLNKLLNNFTISPQSQHKIQSEDDLFIQQLQRKLKELAIDEQIIINKKQHQQTNKSLTSNISISKSKIKRSKEFQNTSFVSPAEKDTSFPIASSPSQQKAKIKSKVGNKKMIRIGY